MLNASGHGIEGLDGIEALGGLERLALADNRIREIAPLAALTGLTWLDLRNNQISDLSPLKELQDLRYLDVSSNEVASVEPLSGLAQLQTLILSHNPTADLTPLLSFEALGYVELDEVQLPPEDESLLSRLQERGIEVFLRREVPDEEEPEPSGIGKIIQTKIAFVANLDSNGWFDIYVLDSTERLRRLTHDEGEEGRSRRSPPLLVPGRDEDRFRPGRGSVHHRRGERGRDPAHTDPGAGGGPDLVARRPEDRLRGSESD